MNDVKPKNPPAFPNPDTGNYQDVSGMTLLDYFAGQIISNLPDRSFTGWPEGSSKKYCEDKAKVAYTLAQAMLTEREKHL